MNWETTLQSVVIVLAVGLTTELASLAWPLGTFHAMDIALVVRCTGNRG
jgi:hypothetical protein